MIKFHFLCVGQADFEGFINLLSRFTFTPRLWSALKLHFISRVITIQSKSAFSLPKPVHIHCICTIIVIPCKRKIFIWSEMCQFYVNANKKANKSNLYEIIKNALFHQSNTFQTYMNSLSMWHAFLIWCRFCIRQTNGNSEPQ